MKIATNREGRSSLGWATEDISWDDFTAKFNSPVTSETKHGSGFVCGPLLGDRRCSSALQSRTMLSLDVDGATAEQMEQVASMLDLFGWAAVMHTTYSHDPSVPDGYRFRVFAPLSEDVEPSEYRALCRAFVAVVAQDVPVDSKSYSPIQLYFDARVPAHSTDTYQSRVLDGVPVPVDILRGSVLEDTPTHVVSTADDLIGTEEAIDAARRSKADAVLKKALSDLTKAEAVAADGVVVEGRNNVLFHAGLPVASFIHAGYLDEEQTLPLLREAVASAPGPDTFSDEEFDTTWSSVMGTAAPQVPAVTQADVDSKAAISDDLAVDLGESPVVGGIKWLSENLGAGRMSSFFWDTQTNNRCMVREEYQEGVGRSVFLTHPNQDQVRSAVQMTGHTFYQRVGKKNAMMEIALPYDAVRVIANHLSPGRERPLAGISSVPLITKAGEVVATTGYDADSKMYVCLPYQVPDLDECSFSQDDAEEAVARIEKVLTDFPFRTVDDKAAYYAMLLAPLLRSWVPQPLPGFAINSSNKGTGKTTLARVAGAIYGINERASIPLKDEEFRKEISSIAQDEHSPYVMFDNVRGTLNMTTLESLLTSPKISFRKLGTSQTITMNNDRVWIITGNNINLGGDAARRFFFINLNYEQKDIDDILSERKFTIPNILSQIRSTRAQMLRDLIIIVASWARAGGVYHQSSSDNYAEIRGVVNGILDFCGVEGEVDPVARRSNNMSEQEEQLYAFLAEVHQRADGKRFPAKMLPMLVQDEEAWPEPIDPSHNVPMRTVIRWLKKHVGTYVGGYRLEARKVPGEGPPIWYWVTYNNEPAALPEAMEAL